MNNSTIIYSLVDPRDGKVFYVGRTCMKLCARLTNHVRDAKKKTTPKALKIAAILASGHRPTIHEIARLENSTRIEIELAEQAWIKFYSITHCLTNTGTASQGGTGENARIELTPELIARLGKETDRRIAYSINCDPRTITYHRTKLGIPIAPTPSGFEPANKKHLPDWVVVQLGKVSDTELGKRAGVSRQRITRERERRGVAACPQWKMRTDNLPQSIIERLGKFPDIVLASECGASVKVIKKARYLRNIPSWRSTFNHPTRRKNKKSV